MLFTYLHLAPDREQTLGLLASGCTAIAYETITDAQGRLPLLAPMSEVAGRNGRAGGCRGTAKGPGRARRAAGWRSRRGCRQGGGAGRRAVVGTHSAKMAVGLGAQVTVLDRSLARLRELDDLFGGRVQLVYASLDAVEQAALAARPGDRRRARAWRGGAEAAVA